MWKKMGLIYNIQGAQSDWKNNSVLTPQPFLLNSEVIRVYSSFRDINGVGRIGYIDVSAKNPSEIINISQTPVLDIGKKGNFDDNGVLLGGVLRVGNKIYMYYVGFQLVKSVKFFAFGGLAVSDSKGEVFTRIQDTPILDRSPEGKYGRCPHTVIFDEGVFKCWYAVIYDWHYINGIPYPVYDIKYIESKNGIDFPKEGVQCITCNENEYRIGRPKVRKLSGEKYEMYYTSDSYNKEYRAGYAESKCGIIWQRMDDKCELKPSFDDSWDSDEASYPAICETKYGTYMFYDGNGMGKSGFGYAKLV